MSFSMLGEESRLRTHRKRYGMATSSMPPGGIYSRLDGFSHSEATVILITELEAFAKSMRRQKIQIVLTNGCFDLLHAGHLSYLRQARELGDKLMVAVNSDTSIRALKGINRPINSQKSRIEALSSLQFVDYVTVFSSLRVTE